MIPKPQKRKEPKPVVCSICGKHITISNICMNCAYRHRRCSAIPPDDYKICMICCMEETNELNGYMPYYDDEFDTSTTDLDSVEDSDLLNEW